MKVYCYDGQVINCDESDPQITRLQYNVEDRDLLIAAIEEDNEAELEENPLTPSLKSVPAKICLEEIGIDFEGFEAYADNTNTVKTGNTWEFDSSGIPARIEKEAEVLKSSLESQLITLSISHDKAVELNLTSKAESIQASIDLVSTELESL